MDAGRRAWSSSSTGGFRLPPVLVPITWTAAGVAVLVTAWTPGNGLDPTDEASYLQAVLARGRGDAFNGFSGFYLRFLWQVAGWDIGVVRLLSLSILVALATVVGWATARLLQVEAKVVVPMTIAASTSYYATSWRTPSYNWLALLGASVACVGLLRLLADASSAWGAVSGLGVAVSATGKLPTAALLAVVVALAESRRPRALLWSAGALVAAVLVHLLAFSPALTLTVIRRSASMLAAVSPDSYTLPGALLAALLGLGYGVVRGVLGGGVFGLLPLVLAARRPPGSNRYTLVCRLAVLASIVTALLTRTWSGGLSTLFVGAGLLPVLLAVAVALAVGRRLGLVAEAPGPHVVAAGVLIAAAAACVFGSALQISWQLVTVSMVLGPAILFLCHGYLFPGRSLTVALVIAAISIGSVIVAIETREDPRRSAPWSRATVPVRLEGVTVRTDPHTARQLQTTTSAAVTAGWRAGTPLIDTTFTPAVPLALQARVPPVLLPAFPHYAAESVCVAVRGLGADWRSAWLIVRPDDSEGRKRQIASYLGRRYPDDYLTVAAFDGRRSYAVQLLRPRPTPIGAPAPAGSCLTP